METVVWGLVCVARALHFIHQEMKSIHGRLSPATVFVTTGGDWRLGGLEILTEHSHWQRLLDGHNLQFAHYWPPEMHHRARESISQPVQAVDAWAFGCLMYDLFSRGRYRSSDELRRIEVIPEPLRQLYSQFLAADGSRRAPLNAFFEHASILQMPFVRLNLALDRLALTERWEKHTVVQTLLEQLDSLPPHFCLGKASPLLQQAIDLGVADASAVQAVLRIHRRFTTKQGPRDHELITATTRWLTSSQIEIRAQVVESLDWLVEQADAKQLNSTLFPAMAANLPPSVSVSVSQAGMVQGSGENRAASVATQQPLPAALRDTILKTIAVIAPRLNERNLNQVLMGHFAKLQLDAEPSIRTNTTVCLGKIATLLNPTTRRKVLVPAFTRAMKDPFPPARAAGILALQATAELYSKDETVSRILPALCQALGDGVADVREQAFHVIEAYLTRLRNTHEQEKQREERERVAEIQRPATLSADVSSGKRTGAADGQRAGTWQLASLAASLVDVCAGAQTETGTSHLASKSSNSTSEDVAAADTAKRRSSGSPSAPSLHSEPQQRQPAPVDAQRNQFFGSRSGAGHGHERMRETATTQPVVRELPTFASSTVLGPTARPVAESLWETALAEERLLTANTVTNRGLAAGSTSPQSPGAPTTASVSAASRHSLSTQPKPAWDGVAAMDSSEWGQLLNSGDTRRRKPVKLGATRRPTS
jgi:SCY1-like protein 1